MPDREEEKSKDAIAAGLAFSGLLQTRNTEATLRWLGFQFGLGLNIAGLSGMGIWLLQQPSNEHLVGMMALSVGALFANRVHFSVLARDGKFMALWNAKAIELERANGIEGGVKIFSSPQYLELRSRRPTIQHILRRTIIVSSIMWGVFGATCAVMLVL